MFDWNEKLLIRYAIDNKDKKQDVIYIYILVICINFELKNVATDEGNSQNEIRH